MLYMRVRVRTSNQRTLYLQLKVGDPYSQPITPVIEDVRNVFNPEKTRKAVSLMHVFWLFFVIVLMLCLRFSLPDNGCNRNATSLDPRCPRPLSRPIYS